MPLRFARTAFTLVVVALLAAPGRAAGQPPARAAAALDVPYLPQTEALCGGAAAAMLFRFWGERHADVQQFAPLVDAKAGGIADTDLTQAIRDKGWIAERLDGSLATIRAEVGAGRPPMLLLEDRPQRYHFVVVVAVDDEGVLLHDPAWGPSRRLSPESLQRAWKPSGYWTLRVTPGRPREPVVPMPPVTAAPPLLESPSHCSELLDAALDAIQAEGLTGAADRLERVRLDCPEDGRVLRELAGIRFAERQWASAALLAEEALERRPGDAYAIDVLGSSRFLLNDIPGALRAWNGIGRPQLDSVRITGLTRTRYSMMALALGLSPNTVLTEAQFTLARRRLESMPDQALTRIALRPEPDGFAVVDVAIVERGSLPGNVVQWGAAAAQSVLEREVSVTIPGHTGQGEIWSADWRWWQNRPRISLEFAAPRLAWPRGVWRVRGAWDSQSYGVDEASALREERLQAQLALGDWLSANLRAEVTLGIDAWRRPGERRDRTVRVGGALEQRFFRDRLATIVSGTQWAGVSGSAGFSQAGVSASFRSRRESTGFVWLGRAGATLAAGDAPLALWGGAGEGRGRGPLLRAHRLLRGGRINGTVFGRRVTHLTVETQRWLDKPSLVRIGAAMFADAAMAGGRPAFAIGRPFQLDVGAGLRVRVPGRGGAFRLDYARGLRDGASAIVASWQAID